MRALLASGALMSKELVRQTREFSDQGHEEQFQYLIFRLKDESFGISIL